MKKSEARASLGVDRMASEEEIKRSFRNKCHEHHPDVGGNKEIFEHIRLSYKRLLGEQEQCASYGQATAELLSAFELAISVITDPEHTDLIFRVNSIVSNGIHAIEVSNTSSATEVKKLKVVLDRLSCKTSNIVSDVIFDKIEDLEELIDNNKYKLAVLKKALEMLKNYDYSFEQLNNFKGFTTSYS